VDLYLSVDAANRVILRAKLEMQWRYEQRYYAAGGWTPPEMLWNSRTGLVRVDITPAPRDADKK
jgi:hypothetical protein